MLHESCAQGRALLEAYLDAIERRDALMIRPDRDLYRYDLKVALEIAREYRTLYWDHVHEHGCREVEGG